MLNLDDQSEQEQSAERPSVSEVSDDSNDEGTRGNHKPNYSKR